MLDMLDNQKGEGGWGEGGDRWTSGRAGGVVGGGGAGWADERAAATAA